MGMWTDRSRREIEAALAGLPVGAGEAECRRALRDAYPFGPRENHPYRVWLRESKRALAERFAALHAGGVPEVTLTVTRRGDRLWLDVACGWCRDTALTSCMMCSRRRAEVADLVASAELLSLLKAGASDGVALHAALDRVEEATGVRPACDELPPADPAAHDRTPAGRNKAERDRGR